MAIKDLLSASAGFRRNQWTGRNPNSSPLFNQFSPRQQERPPGTMARKAMGLGWQGYNEQGDHNENSRAAIAWLKQNHPSGLQKLIGGVGNFARGFYEPPGRNFQTYAVQDRQSSGDQPVEYMPGQPPSVQSPTAPIDRQPYPYRNSLFDETPIELQGIPPQAPPTEQPETQQTQQAVTGTSPNMGMEQFRRRMGAAGFDLNTPVPPQTMIGGSGVPADVRKKIFRDEMDQRIRGSDLWTGMGIGESAGGQGPPSVERLTQEAEAPRSFWQKAGSFFKKPEVSSAMIATGGKMMEAAGQPGATVLGSLGTGLQAGQEAAAGIREEDRLGRQEGRLDTQLAQQTEQHERQITAEDLSIAREEERREAYDNIFADGVFNDEGFSSAMEIALKHGDTGFATALIQMRPKDDVKDYEITTKYNSERGFNEDHLLLIDPKTGEFETKLIGRSKLAAGAGVSGSGDSYDNLWQPGIMGGFEMVRGERPYMMAGFELIDPDDPSKGHKRVGWFDPRKWQSIFANAIARGAGGEEMGWLEAMATDNVKEWVNRSEWGQEIQAAYTGALQAINPIVRYLSGAQMTNKEAMRYYGSLIPGFGDSEEQVRIKARGLEMMLNAMASGNEEAQRMMASAGFTRYHGGSSVPWTMMSDDQQEREGARIQDSIQRVYDQARMEIEREDRAAGITPRGEETDEDYYRRIRGGA